MPSAQALIEGGLFNKGDDGLWETPEIAKVLLRSMVTNHEKDMEKLITSSGKTLLKVHGSDWRHRKKMSHLPFSIEALPSSFCVEDCLHCLP